MYPLHQKLLTKNVSIYVSDGMEITVYTKTPIYEKFDHIFYNITGVRVDYKIAGLQLHLNNLFDGVKVLGKLILKEFFM